MENSEENNGRFTSGKMVLVKKSCSRCGALIGMKVSPSAKYCESCKKIPKSQRGKLKRKRELSMDQVSFVALSSNPEDLAHANYEIHRQLNDKINALSDYIREMSVAKKK